ncbi:TVP38/TMEM64 family protein [Paenibacillus brevis]|uniref:TVP38/TMEM64 family membrane protein n=1 Tax=Paenibacillus brevis TaxID=2841508 RepID=A0ABS6FWM9_9BACL|nr:VTT domain-containing protein [Paenibacillus brevis]MBU5674646.1 VTT domain-containing protein [Paenibacillus brevis]
MKGPLTLGAITKQNLYRILLILLAAAVLIPVLIYLPEILKLTVSIDDFRDYILSTGKSGPIIFIFFQILQTVIAPIPGEVIQIAGGYIYGTTLGTTYSTLGLLIGAITAFYFTRLLGRAYVEKLLNKNKLKWMANLLGNKKFAIFLFLIFIIPGMPKDMFIYAAGLTPIKPLKFFTILLVARFPWLLASVCIGSNIYHKNYVATVVIVIVAVTAFLLGIIYKDKLINSTDSR